MRDDEERKARFDLQQARIVAEEAASNKVRDREASPRPERGTKEYTSHVCSDGKKRGVPIAIHQESQPCMTKGCEGRCGGDDLPKGQRGARGLCKRCHGAASRLVKKGATTWAELEELGMAIPKFNSLLEHELANARKAAKEKGG